MNKKNYIASYQSEIITENKIIPANGCSCISFENIGTTTANIDRVQPLESGQIRTFNEQPYVQIDHNFLVNFDNTSDCKVLIVRTFYKEV